MKEAILSVNMINEFVYGRLGSEGARSIVPNVKRLIDYARGAGKDVVFANDGHSEGDLELAIWGEHAMKGSKEAQVIDELAPRDGEAVFEKRVYNGFSGTGLDQYLRARGIDTLYITGVATQICVQHTVADAFFHGYKIVLVKDGVQSFDPNLHEEGMKYMTQMYNPKIKTVDEIISNMEAQKIDAENTALVLRDKNENNKTS